MRALPVVFGAALGLAFGAGFDNLGVGLVLGATIGLLLAVAFELARREDDS